MQKDPDIVHTFNHKGEPFSYNPWELYSHADACDYTKQQEDKFKACLPKLACEYRGQYIIFEDYLVIDSDINEIDLLVRASKNTNLRNRPLIFCKFIPLTFPKDVEYWLDHLDHAISSFLIKNDEYQKRISSRLNFSIFASAIFLYLDFEVSYTSQFYLRYPNALLTLICILALSLWNIKNLYWSQFSSQNNVDLKHSLEAFKATLIHCSQREDHGFWHGRDKEQMRKSLKKADSIYLSYLCTYYPELLSRVW
jgi:hypothetical protein